MTVAARADGSAARLAVHDRGDVDDARRAVGARGGAQVGLELAREQKGAKHVGAQREAAGQSVDLDQQAKMMQTMADEYGVGQ